MESFEERLNGMAQPRQAVKVKLSKASMDRLEALSRERKMSKSLVIEAALRTVFEPSQGG